MNRHFFSPLFLSGFQFPFPRDPPCNAIPGLPVSAFAKTFSSLFLGIRLATLCMIVSRYVRCHHFQFPFPRDPPCNLARQRQRQSKTRRTFSSLFLGIRLATVNNHTYVLRSDNTFSSLFLGIRLATSSPVKSRPQQAHRFQFPFPRDPSCNKQEGTG